MKMNRKDCLQALLAAALCSSPLLSALAQDQWPSRPVTMIVPFAAGVRLD